MGLPMLFFGARVSSTTIANSSVSAHRLTMHRHLRHVFPSKTLEHRATVANCQRSATGGKVEPRESE
jgi:hypothetical protein